MNEPDPQHPAAPTSDLAQALWQDIGLEQALLQAAIDRGDHDGDAINASLLLHLHAQLCRRAFPQLVGWRVVALDLPGLCLPRPSRLRDRIQAHLIDADFRPTERGLEALIESLARLEGGLHALYPFANLCEPTIRLLMRIQLRRLGRPGVLLDRDTTPLYLQALSQGRLRHWSWMIPVWRLRLDWQSSRVTRLRGRRIP